MKHILVIATLALLLTTPLITRAQERVGTSCADCPNYSGAFSIENPTGVTIPYEYRWGNGPWRHMSLQSGHTETHSYPLGAKETQRSYTLRSIRSDRRRRSVHAQGIPHGVVRDWVRRVRFTDT